MAMSHEEYRRLGLLAGLASASVALVLTGLKLWALGETGALSVAASLADSALDLLISLGGLAAMLYAARPPDEDHAFGHTSAEDLAALGQAVFVLISAGVIAWAAVARLLSDSPPPLQAEIRGMVVMGVSITLTLALVLWQRHVVQRTGNRVVAADSAHYIGDLVPNAGAILSLWVSRQFGMTGVDSVVALAAAAMLAITALRIGKGAWDALMDRRADPELISSIKEIVGNWPGVDGFHDLRTRTAGPRVFVSLHIELDGSQTLDEAHATGAALRRAILKAHPQCDVILHKDPTGVQPHPEDPAPRPPSAGSIRKEG